MFHVGKIVIAESENYNAESSGVLLCFQKKKTFAHAHYRASKNEDIEDSKVVIFVAWTATEMSYQQ